MLIVLLVKLACFVTADQAVFVYLLDEYRGKMQNTEKSIKRIKVTFKQLKR